MMGGSSVFTPEQIAAYREQAHALARQPGWNLRDVALRMTHTNPDGLVFKAHCGHLRCNGQVICDLPKRPAVKKPPSRSYEGWRINGKGA